MRTKEKHREYMRKWRAKRKLAQTSRNSPNLPVKTPSNGVTSQNPTKSITQNCNTIFPTKKYVDIYLFHPAKKTWIHCIECSGKTLLFLKKLGFELENKNLIEQPNSS